LARTTLQVGTAEKHTIGVEVSSWSGRTKMYVDGQEIMNKLEYYSFGAKTETFKVGEKEQHQIQL
jgi:hypothetical protein